MKRGRISAGLGALAACIWMASAVSGQSIVERRRDLASAKGLALRSARLADKLEARAAQEADAAAQAEVRAAALAARIQANEAEISAGEARLRLIQKLREDVRARLAEKQRPAIRLTAALQTLASRPPALALVQPGTMADLVHVRMLLAGLAPEIRKRTVDLQNNLQESRQLEADAREAMQRRAQSRKTLAENRASLIRLEADHRAASSRFAKGAMAEQDRAIALGEQARDIVDLIDQLGQQSVRQSSLVRLPGPLMRPKTPEEAAANAEADEPASQSALIASDRLPYRLPVLGQLVTGLGEVSTSGARAKGLTFQTQPNAQVVAPRSGRVAFAGPFRGYGQIVIIDHGGGWTSLVTNLEVVNVAVGQTVIDGSPIGRTGAGRPQVTIELRRGGRPVDITPFVT